MSIKMYDRAFRLFDMNIRNYPKSPNVYDSMGELLMNKGDTAGAIRNYEKSLELSPGNANAKKMIAKMKK
jgi:predicted negative regulator of RcsB-dependent stress response